MQNSAKLSQKYTTQGGVIVSRYRTPTPYENAVETYIDKLDSRRGAVLSSNYEYPGRYTRWDTAIIDPPIGLVATGRNVSIEAYNSRGQVLLEAIASVLKNHLDIKKFNHAADCIKVKVRSPDKITNEEDRTRLPSVFSVLRAIVGLFKSAEDSNIGFFGAFGYDLTFQFDPIEFARKRPADHRDLVLYLPDEILVVDHHSAKAWHDRYEFEFNGKSTVGLPREGQDIAFVPAKKDPERGDHAPGEYAELVRKAMVKFKRGDLFEVVPGQVFYEKCQDPPSVIAKRLKKINPSPYSFFFNLGNQEYLVGASPEMFVRVTGRRIETCPISGTIRRGEDAIADSEQVLKLLNSKKDESELTMCSDVDRNDKSRVCEPGSVKVIGRRQIEMYSKLIHTVDHIEGRLREDMDAFDGFLSHAWAVTVTGAPKLWAMRFIEENEKSPRTWYGGAIGMIKFNGDMNTGLTLRTVRIKDGIAQVRAGATLLFDSDPVEEEKETELKASAMIAAIRGEGRGNMPGEHRLAANVGKGVRVLLIDHEDSFVHMLANYIRQTGAEVSTIRSPVDEKVFDDYQPDLVVLSPGPGLPKDFDCKKTIQAVRKRQIPLFGVCLGMQAITEAWGGELRQLAVPVHGKPSRIRVIEAGKVFSGLDNNVTVGRYHSVFIDPATLSKEFFVSAETDDGVIMGIEHRSEPIAAVQFHPESIMTLGGDAGMRMIENVIAHLANSSRRMKSG